MEPFEFNSVKRVIFARGGLGRIGELAAELGHSAMVVTNAGQPGDGGVVDGLAEMLAEAEMPSAFWRQRGEPTVDGVETATKLAREKGCDMVIGLGGGSAIDTAKAVAALLTNGGGPLDYMEVVGKGRAICRPAAAWIAVPTTAGTGAEVTRNAVIASPERHFKASIRSVHLLPRVALIDAELGVPVRPDVTARAGMDAICQLIESYTSARAQPITDALAIKGVALAGGALRRAYGDGGDLDAREAMAMAALLGGVTLTNAGLGAVHGFAAPLGANFPIPHGVVCGVLLGGVMAANVKALRAESAEHLTLGRYAEIGRALTNRPSLADAEAIHAGIEFAAALVKDLHIPPLGQFGLTAQHIPEMVALAGKSSSMRCNPVRLSDDVLAEILQGAL